MVVKTMEASTAKTKEKLKRPRRAIGTTAMAGVDETFIPSPKDTAVDDETSLPLASRVNCKSRFQHSNN